jgi:RNA polymerase sigma-70 factor, ECF subfamily
LRDLKDYPMPLSPAQDERTRRFLRLLGPQEHRLQTFVLSLVPNFADAEDVAQQVRIRLWEQFDDYDPAKDFGGWMRTVARYLVLAYREKQSRERRRFSARSVELLADELAAMSDELDAGQRALRDCFEQLPELKRDLLVSYYSGEQSTREIAAARGWTFDATRQSLLRTRITLRDCIDKAMREEKGP